jgi:MFS family permease
VLARFYLFRALGLTWLYVPFQWFYLRAHGLSATELMALNTVFCVAAVFLEVPTGAMADRLGRRAVLTAGALSSALSCVFFVVLPNSMVWLVMANVLAALAMTSVSGADSAYLFDFLAWRGRGAHYRRAEASSSAFKLASTSVGGLVGWVMVACGNDLSILYAITAILSSAAALLALSLPEPWRASTPETGDLRPARGWRRCELWQAVIDTVGHGRRAFSLVWTMRDMLGLLVLSSLLFPVLRIGLFLDQPFVELLGFDLASLGLVYAAKDLVAAVAAAFTALLLARLGESRLLTMIPLAVVVALGAMAMARSPWAVGLVLLPTVAFGIYSPLVRIFVNRRLEGSRDRATVLSTEGMARRLGFAIFSPFIGVAVDVWSLGSALMISAAWASGVALIAFLLPLSDGIPRQRQRRSLPPRAVTAQGELASRAPLRSTSG